MIVKRINAISCAKMLGALYAIIGLIIGAIIAVASLLGATVAPPEANSSGIVSTIFGVGAIIFVPILYGIFGFISGLIFPLVYNFLAGIVGGIEVDVS